MKIFLEHSIEKWVQKLKKLVYNTQYNNFISRGRRNNLLQFSNLRPSEYARDVHENKVTLINNCPVV